MSAFEHVAKKERDGSAQKYEEKCRARPFSRARCMPSRAPPCLPGQVHLQKTSRRFFPGCGKLGKKVAICSRKENIFFPHIHTTCGRPFLRLPVLLSCLRSLPLFTQPTDRAINLEIEGALLKQIQREGRPVVLGVWGQTAMCMGYLLQLVVLWWNSHHIISNS